MKNKYILTLILIITIVIPTNLATAKSAHTAYYVQVGVFSDVEKSNIIFTKLHNNGLAVYKQSLGKNTKVFAGYYNTEQEAEAILNRVKVLGYNAELKLANFSYDKYKNNTVYTVQVGVFSKERNAYRLYDKLINYHYEPYNVSVNNNIRVYMGDYFTLAEAKSVLNGLQKLGFNCIIVEEDLNNRLGLNYLVDEPGNKGYIRSKNYILRNDKFLAGLYGSYTMFFFKNKDWNLSSEPFIDLEYEKSQIMLTKPSTMTVYVNDIPVYSEFLKEENKVRIFINKNYVYDGYNSVTFHSFNRVTELPCEDDLNPANWLKILGTTYIHLEYSRREDDTSLKDFPYPYLVEGLNTPLDAIALVPQNPDNEELSGLMMLSSVFGSKERFYYKSLDIKKFGEKNDLSNENIIVISKRGNLPEVFREYFSTEELNLSSKNTLIKEIVSPYNINKKLLFLIWGSRDSFVKALKALTEPDIVKQMRGDTYDFEADFIINSRSKSMDDSITFQESGYKGVHVEGLFEHVIGYEMQVPANWKPLDGSKIQLHLRYSEVLDFKRSLVTVLVNDVPIGSSSLSKDMAHNDIIELLLTEDCLSENGVYSVSVQFSLYLDNAYCETRVDKSVWAYVVEDSNLYFPHEKNKNIVLRNYQGLFAKDDILNDMNFILSENYGLEELNAAADISSYLARFGNSFQQSYVHLVNEMPGNLSNCIAIISAEHNADMLGKLNDYAFVKYDIISGEFQSTAEIPLLETRNIASMQIVPYNNEKMLILSAINKVGLSWAKKFLTDTESLFLLNGDVALINNEGIVRGAVFDSDLKASLERPVFGKGHNYQRQKEKKRFKLNIVNIKLVIVVLSLFIIVIGVILYLKRKE